MSAIAESTLSEEILPTFSVGTELGNALPSPITSSYASPDLADFHWHKVGAVGSRKLYWQITIGLLTVCLLGATFIALGSVYIYDARQADLAGSSSIPLLLCVVALGEY